MSWACGLRCVGVALSHCSDCAAGSKHSFAPELIAKGEALEITRKLTIHQL